MLFNMRSITLFAALAIAFPGVANAQPLSPVEEHLKAANAMAQRHDFAAAVEEYSEAFLDAETQCEKHWAYAGLSAAFAGLSAQAVLQDSGHPQQGQAISTAFQSQLQDAWKVADMTRGCG